MTITVTDESPAGEKLGSFTLEDLTEKVTARELIRARIYQEVQDHNQRLPEVYSGLVQPSKLEQRMNERRRKKVKPINWERQFQVACEAFETNGFFLLVDEQQIEDLDQEVVVKVDSAISFVKLVPLVGG